VESAVALPAGLQEEVQAKLTGIYGSRLATAFSERPSLIGGMRIQVGSDVYDGSVRAELASLQRKF